MTETQNTPETDAAAKEFLEEYEWMREENPNYVSPVIAAAGFDFARSLETRLNAALAELAQLKRPEAEAQSHTESDGCPTEGARLKREWRNLTAELAQKKAKREEAEKERDEAFATNKHLAECNRNLVVPGLAETELATLRAEVEKLRADSERVRNVVFSQMVDAKGNPASTGYLPLFEALADSPYTWAQAHATHLLTLKEAK